MHTHIDKYVNKMNKKRGKKKCVFTLLSDRWLSPHKPKEIITTAMEDFSLLVG